MAKTNKTMVIASGYFNPLHKGHIEYLNRSKALGDFLYVIVNNDVQRQMKGSNPFMEEKERALVIQNLKSVDAVIVSIDNDNRLVENTIEFIYNWRCNEFDNFIFTNGGDQTEYTIGEREICEKLGIEMVFGLGDKIQSSSTLIKNSK